MTTTFAAHPWVTVDEFFDDPVFSCGFNATDDRDLIVELIDDASDILAHATGGRVRGQMRATFRPTRDSDVDAACGWMPEQTFAGRLANPVPLPTPNAEVLEVVVDGVTLFASDYRVVDGRWLVRTEGSWPTSNDLRLDDTEDGTWSLTVRWGEPLRGLAKRACMSLVQEMGAPYVGKQSPVAGRITSANVQGASYSFESAADALTDGVEDLTVHLQRFLGVDAASGRHGSAVLSPDDGLGWTLHVVSAPSSS